VCVLLSYTLLLKFRRSNSNIERDRVNVTAPDIIKSLFDAPKCY